jgi:hypothetical protein
VGRRNVNAVDWSLGSGIGGLQIGGAVFYSDRISMSVPPRLHSLGLASAGA